MLHREEEFVPVLESLLERRDRIDHVVIETSGLALPKPRAGLPVAADPRGLHGRPVIALVDGPPCTAASSSPTGSGRRAAQRRPQPRSRPPLQELFEDQLGAADLVVISKVDALDAAALDDVLAKIRAHTKPGVKVITASHGKLPFDVILGLDAAAEDTIDEVHTHHDEDHEHGREHNHELFDTIVVRLPMLGPHARSCAGSTRWCASTVSACQGFAAVADKPMRLVVQGVGSRFESYFDRPWAADEARATELVMIGSHLDREQITETLLRASAS